MIGLGYYVCTSEVGDTRQDWVPSGRPDGTVRPLDQTSRRLCGHQYQDFAPSPGTVPPTCSCGTFAIGLCVECNLPVCGLHSSISDGRRLCQTDLGSIERRRYQDTQAAIKASDLRAVSRAAEEQRKLLSTKEQIESFVSALNRCGQPELVVVTTERYRGTIRGWKGFTLYSGWLMTSWEEGAYVNRDQPITVQKHNLLTTESRWHEVQAPHPARHAGGYWNLYWQGSKRRTTPIPQEVPPHEGRWGQVWHTMKRMNDQYSLGLTL